MCSGRRWVEGRRWECELGCRNGPGMRRSTVFDAEIFEILEGSGGSVSEQSLGTSGQLLFHLKPIHSAESCLGVYTHAIECTLFKERKQS